MRVEVLFYLVIVVTCLVGCGPKITPLLSESWSENYALASNGAEAQPPEINDGRIDTLGVTEHPKREYLISLPEIKNIDRIVVYSGNLISYEIFYLDHQDNKWKSASYVGKQKGMQKVHSDRYKLMIPRFEHRVKVRTDRLRLIVYRTTEDGVVTTRNPKKTDKIINQRTEYITMGRDRVRIDLYDVYTYGRAAIREIEVYSQIQSQDKQ